MSVLGERTKARRLELGWPQADLARKVGVSQQAIEQLENGEVRRPRYLPDLAKALRVSMEWLRGESDSHATETETTELLTVRGYVQGGHWQEALEWPPEDWRTIAAPAESPRYPGIPLFGLEVRGTSMNEIFPEGTVLGCINLIHHPVNVTPGKFVIVERTNDSGEVEATVKEITKDADGVIWLVPRSSDPRFKAPLRLDERDKTRLVALVVKAILDV